jgi:hypothetical protein
MSWNVAHACVRGSAHVRSGLPNQDAVQCIATPGEGGRPSIAIAAVSDGHGGARHFRSQIGSTLAVSTAVDVLKSFLSQHATGAAADEIGADDIRQLQRDIVERWLGAVTADLENHPLTAGELEKLQEGDGAEGRTSVETLPTIAYGATLLVAAATDNLILYLQLGDGEILCVDATGETSRPLPADARLVGNQTTSLCQPDAWREFRAAWFAAPDLPALVLLSTDGYANSFRSDEDFLKIGGDYLELMRDQGIAVLAEELPEILKEATEQGSGDDITLAILQGDLKKSAAEGNGMPVKPKISSESRSLLIEQLKARHSSQHRRLDELSTRLEETRKDNRRLQVLLVLLILIILGASAYVFRGHFFSPSPPKSEPKPAGAAPEGRKGGRPPEGTPPLKDTKAAAITEWKLEIAGRDAITLDQQHDVSTDQILGNGSKERFARIAMLKPKMRMINDSPYEWTVVSTTGNKTTVKNGRSFILGSAQQKIMFTKDVRGTITPVLPNTQPDPPASERPVLPTHRFSEETQ